MSQWRSAITRDTQFELIEVARQELLASAKAAAIPLHRVEFVVPFVPMDFSLSAVLFLETDAQLDSPDAKRWTPWLKSEFLRILGAHGYPERWISDVDFVFDSHENVVKNFEGRYFYRLR